MRSSLRTVIGALLALPVIAFASGACGLGRADRGLTTDQARSLLLQAQQGLRPGASGCPFLGRTATPELVAAIAAAKPDQVRAATIDSSGTASFHIDAGQRRVLRVWVMTERGRCREFDADWLR